MPIDLVTWRRKVKACGYLARSAAFDERPQVLPKGGGDWKTFNTQQEAVDYAEANPVP